MRNSLYLLPVLVATVWAQTYESYYFPQIKVDSLGGEENLTCDCGDYCDIFPTNSTPTFWIIPSLENTNGSNLDTLENIKVYEDNYKLEVSNIQQKDIGTYFCVLTIDEGGEYYMQKIGLNLKGPYFEDLGEKYTRNIVLGFSGLVSFILSALYVWVVYHFSYFRRHESKVDPRKDDWNEMKENSYVKESSVVSNGKGASADVLGHGVKIDVDGVDNDVYENDEMTSQRL